MEILKLLQQIAQEIRAIRNDFEEIERIIDKLAGALVVIKAAKEVAAGSKTEKGDEKETEKAETKKKQPRGGKKEKLDRGKIWALHDLGWTPAEIAQDVKGSAQTVSTILKSESRPTGYYRSEKIQDKEGNTNAKRMEG